MKHGAITTVKFAALSKRLGLPKFQAVGVLESLWLFAQHNARDGDLSKFTPLEIAGWLEWQGDESELIDALVECRWLDRAGEQLLIHDWCDHRPNWIRGMEASSATKPATTVTPSVTLSVAPGAAPPNQTGPDQTQPKEPVSGAFQAKVRNGSHPIGSVSRAHAQRKLPPEHGKLLSEITERLMSDDAALFSWASRAAAAGLVPKTGDSVLEVFAAAEHAVAEQSKARKSGKASSAVKIFAANVRDGQLKFSTNGDEQRAAVRLRSLRAAASSQEAQQFAGDPLRLAISGFAQKLQMRPPPAEKTSEQLVAEFEALAAR